jgi:hypothetical protein
MSKLRPCKNLTCHHLIDGESPKRYCSNACRQRAYRDRKKADPLRRPIQIEIRQCAYCCQPFEPKRTNQRVCKPAHRQALYRELKSLKVRT